MVWSIWHIEGEPELSHMIMYWMKFEDKGKIPMIKIDLSKETPVEKIFYPPLLIVSKYVLEPDAMKLLSK